MIVTPRIALRIALIVIVAVILQVSFFSFISIFGATPVRGPGRRRRARAARRRRRRRRLRVRRRTADGLAAAADARRLLARPAVDRLPRRALPRGLRDPQRHRPGAARRRLHDARRRRLRRDRADARGRRAGQPAGRPRDPRPGPARRPARLRRLPARPLGPRTGARRLQAVQSPARRGAPSPPRRSPQPAASSTPRRGGARAAPRRMEGSPDAARTGADRASPPSSRSGSASSAASRLVAFAIIFLRLWYLEVLSGDQYLAKAQNNQVREFTVQAPRGEILDRHGRRAGRQPHRPGAPGQVPEPAELEAAPPAPRSSASASSSGLRPAQIRNKIRSEAKESRGLPGDPAPRRALRHRLLPAREPGPVPRDLGRARLRAPLPAGLARRAPARLRGRGRLDPARRPALRQRCSPATRSARTGSSPPTTASCAARTARPRSRSTPPDSRPAASSPRASRRRATTSC